MAKRNTTKILSKADLLTGGLKKDYCDVPELGGKVMVRSLSGRLLKAYNERIKALGKNTEIDADNSMGLMAYLISLTVLDSDGSLMFTEEEANRLIDGNISIMLTLTQKAMELSGINAQAIAEVKDKLKNEMTSSSTSS
jgi:hypothetical protein